MWKLKKTVVNEYERVNKGKRFISLNDSLILYGIAILIMIFHHCFSIPSRLGYNYISSIGNYELEARIAYIGKLCIAIYAFITGYAMSVKSLQVKEKRLLFRFKNDIYISVKQLIKFFSKYWYVFILFIGIGVFAFNIKLSPKQVLWGALYGRCDYNGEWWYVERYLKFLIVYPFAELLCFGISEKKYRKVSIALTGAIIVIVAVSYCGFLNKFSLFLVRIFMNLTNTYMLIFLISFIIGRFYVFELINSFINLNKYVSVCISVFGIAACVAARWFVITEPAQAGCDVYLIPFLIYFTVNIMHHCSKINSKIVCILKKCLFFLGKNSTFMWLTHTFWIYYYFQPIVLLPKYSSLIYVWAVILSLITAMFLNYIYKNSIEKIVNKIVKKI